MDPGTSIASNITQPNSILGTPPQLPPLPEDGMLINLDNEAKLHAWLLQEMTKTGKAHWRECAEYYERHKPTLPEVNPKEDDIKFDQYTKALAHIGTAPDIQGRLNVINQVRVFEQNFLRVMKGLSRACESHAKLLLNGIYEFLERLRTLETATEQAAQSLLRNRRKKTFIHSWKHF